MNKRVIIDLPDELVELAERQAAKQGRSLTDVIADSLRAAVAEKSPASSHERKLPRISSADDRQTGSFNIDTLHEIEEMEDAEYIERLNRGFK